MPKCQMKDSQSQTRTSNKPVSGTRISSCTCTITITLLTFQITARTQRSPLQNHEPRNQIQNQNGPIMQATKRKAYPAPPPAQCIKSPQQCYPYCTRGATNSQAARHSSAVSPNRQCDTEPLSPLHFHTPPASTVASKEQSDICPYSR